jgi:hypothetical protein
VNDSNQQRTTMFKGQPVSKNCWLMKGTEC